MAENKMIKIMNAIMFPLLRSRLHFLASHGLMLITVTGRKTGKLYTTPVAYRREGERLVFFSGRGLAWIKNLQGGAPVRLVLKGKEVPAFAKPCPGDPDHQRLLQLMYPNMAAEKAAELVLVEVILSEPA
ncbi:MAG: nitroreductase/quinone reductase family protein [Chloroflexota bacterium]